MTITESNQSTNEQIHQSFVCQRQKYESFKFNFFNHFFTVKSQLTAGSVNMPPGLGSEITVTIIKHVFTVEFFFY